MHNESTLRLFLKIVEQLDESLLHRLVSVFLYLVRRRSWNATMLSRVGTIEFLVVCRAVSVPPWNACAVKKEC